MNDKFRNKYRIQSNRMPGWNYSGKKSYFITLLTQNRECNMSTIIKKRDKVLLKYLPFGSIIKTEWLKSFELRKELFLDEYRIMPNHIHAIIILKTNELPISNNNGIKKLNDTITGNGVEAHGRASQCENIEDLASQHENRNDTTEPEINSNNSDSKNQSLIRLPKSISSFIAGFKSSVNTEIDNYIDENRLNIPKYNRNNHFFQPNYHDHLIRNAKEYYRIKNYIINNPKNWKGDSLFEGN